MTKREQQAVKELCDAVAALEGTPIDYRIGMTLAKAAKACRDILDHSESCLCVFAIEGASRDGMAVPGPHHDMRCHKYREDSP